MLKKCVKNLTVVSVVALALILVGTAVYAASSNLTYFKSLDMIRKVM